MGLTSGGQMDTGECSGNCMIQIRDVNLRKMHVDFARSMSSRHVLPVDNR